MDALDTILAGGEGFAHLDGDIVEDMNEFLGEDPTINELEGEFDGAGADTILAGGEGFAQLDGDIVEDMNEFLGEDPTMNELGGAGDVEEDEHDADDPDDDSDSDTSFDSQDPDDGSDSDSDSDSSSDSDSDSSGDSDSSISGEKRYTNDWRAAGVVACLLCGSKYRKLVSMELHYRKKHLKGNKNRPACTTCGQTVLSPHRCRVPKKYKRSVRKKKSKKKKCNQKKKKKKKRS